MNKKILSLLVAGALFAGIGMSTECFAAPHGNRGLKNPPHKEMRHQQSQRGHKQFAKKGPKKEIKKAPSKKEFQNNRGHSKFEKKNEHKKNIKQFNKNRKQNLKNNRRPEIKKHNAHRGTSGRHQRNFRRR